jgi:hypothetical protein
VKKPDDMVIFSVWFANIYKKIKKVVFPIAKGRKM